MVARISKLAFLRTSEKRIEKLVTQGYCEAGEGCGCGRCCFLSSMYSVSSKTPSTMKKTPTIRLRSAGTSITRIPKTMHNTANTGFEIVRPNFFNPCSTISVKCLILLINDEKSLGNFLIFKTFEMHL